MLNLMFLLLGVSLLTIGGEALIRGSLAASKRLRVSPLLSGLVIVGFGTSAPELVVSVNAALNQQADIAIGNVVGSNIANVLLILGICALIAPMKVKPLALRRDAVTVVAASIFFLVLVSGSLLGRADGVFLLIALLVYLIWAYRSERNYTSSAELNIAEAEVVQELPKSVAWTVTAVIIGLLLLISGSQVLLIGAVGIAENLGISEAVIGLTLVAVGTSLPELSISVIAALRGHADVAIGNILGSNIFNLFGILGVSALLQPLPVHMRILQFDQWVMLASSVLLFLFLYTGRRLSRLEGGALLTAYGVYLGLSFIAFNA